MTGVMSYLDAPSLRELLLTARFHSMKYDAIVEQGIPIHERVPIPEEMIPEDSKVEIDAKIHAGYCRSLCCSKPNRARANSGLVTTGKVMTDAELAAVHGRAWDDVDH